jgi:hypothetical protein
MDKLTALYPLFRVFHPVAVTGSYTDLSDTPSASKPVNFAKWVFDTTNAAQSVLSKVAFTNNYGDLSDTPSASKPANFAKWVFDTTNAAQSVLSKVAFTNNYGDLSDTPSASKPANFAKWVFDTANAAQNALTKVAFTGNYADLSVTPSASNPAGFAKWVFDTTYAEQNALAKVAFSGSFSDLSASEGVHKSYSKWGSTSSSSLSLVVNAITFTYRNGTIYMSSPSSQKICHDNDRILVDITPTETAITTFAIGPNNAKVLYLYPGEVGRYDSYFVSVRFDTSTIPFLDVSWQPSYHD